MRLDGQAHRAILRVALAEHGEGRVIFCRLTDNRGPTVHEEVRQDILADDIRKEGRTVRRDLLGPMTRLRFGPDAPVPFFTRRPSRPANTRELAEVLDVAVNQLGVKIPLGWAHDVLGIPQGGEAEAMVPGRAK